VSGTVEACCGCAMQAGHQPVKWRGGVAFLLEKLEMSMPDRLRAVVLKGAWRCYKPLKCSYFMLMWC